MTKFCIKDSSRDEVIKGLTGEAYDSDFSLSTLAAALRDPQSDLKQGEEVPLIFTRIIPRPKKDPELENYKKKRSDPRDIKGAILCIDVKNSPFNNAGGISKLLAVAKRSEALGVILFLDRKRGDNPAVGIPVFTLKSEQTTLIYTEVRTTPKREILSRCFRYKSSLTLIPPPLHRLPSLLADSKS